MNRNGSEQPAQPMQPRMPYQPGMPMPYQPRTPYQPGMPTPYVPGSPFRRPPSTAPVPDMPREPGPPVMTDPDYLQGYLTSLKGKFVRIDFLIGTNTFLDKSGTLLNVGVDFITLREAESDDIIVADLYSIKFVKVFL